MRKMLLGLSGALPALVESRFSAAKASGALIFSPTEVAIVRTSQGVPFQVRYCPALAKKPTPQKDNSNAPAKKPDPFENPPDDLRIADVPSENPSHLLVLNKFPIIPKHFILATKINKQQTHLLEKEDLEATHACLKAWDGRSETGKHRRLFAFFNSGEHSGASQPRRHLQFVPVEGMADCDDVEGWIPLIDRIAPATAGTRSKLVSRTDLPFTHFAAHLSPDIDAETLHNTYMELYSAAAGAVHAYIKIHPGNLDLHPAEGGSSPISYNLALTTEMMTICPRKKEGKPLRRTDGSETGPVALNGTMLAGTLMVKGQEEWDLLRRDASALDGVLSAVGIPQDDAGSNSEANKL